MSIFTKTGCCKKYLITHPWELIIHYCRDLKCAWQRAVKGYCFRDLWSIDEWFLKLMPRMLQEFKNNSYGYPAEFNNSEEWDNILNRMIYCLKEAHIDTCSIKNEFEYQCDFNFKSTGDGYSTLETIYPTEKDKEMSELYYKKELEIEKYREEKLQEGLQLFVKYFNGLWN